MTRDTDVFIPLEERTAIANREGADLFLSIHANASRNTKARGIETYFLNFASNPEAAAVAARENSASAQAMHSLPDIVQGDRAEQQDRRVARLRRHGAAGDGRAAGDARTSELQDLGVKQAPFVVLIGAAMPSVLAEISFVTNKQEGAAAEDRRLPAADRRGAVRRGPATIRQSLKKRQSDGGSRGRASELTLGQRALPA